MKNCKQPARSIHTESCILQVIGFTIMNSIAAAKTAIFDHRPQENIETVNSFEANSLPYLTKKSTGLIFRVSPEGVKHMDVLNKMIGKSGQKGFSAVALPFLDRLLNWRNY